ncbi:MAG: toll/interleukin-1 receptor domain-containing protein, partial [Planctomycetota bacterium]
MSNDQYHTFLSYNREDKAIVEELAHRLKQAGIRVWLDKWNLMPGTSWQPAIEEALAVCNTCTVCIGPSGLGPWQNEEMRAAIRRRVNDKSGEFRVIPVLLPGTQRPERSRLPTFLSGTTWVEFRNSLDEEDAFRGLVWGIKGTKPKLDSEQVLYEGVCPYRGLQTFQTEHTAFFFGREALTEWLRHELRPAPTSAMENRFLAIIGASGSGKSSLAHAGLVPAIKRGELDNSHEWPIVSLRPGHDPVESLAVALFADSEIGKSMSSVSALMSEIISDERTLHLMTRVSLHSTPETRRVVVLIDQFEEIFTLCNNDSHRKAVIENLLYASSVAHGRTVVVLTMRADFYSKCAEYSSLAAALSDHQVLVGPLTEEELHRAIECPAQLVGCELEAGLTELLVQDVMNQAGALPLLQHA